jgi:hypothetical protein
VRWGPGACFVATQSASFHIGGNNDAPPVESLLLEAARAEVAQARGAPPATTRARFTYESNPVRGR